MLGVLTTFFLSFTVSCLLYYEVKRRLKYRNYNLPPSMPNYFLVGSIPSLPSFYKTQQFFTDEMKKKGPLIGFHIFSGFKLVLNGKECMTEALLKNGHAFSDRPRPAANKILNPNQKGIMFHPYNDEFRKYHKKALGVFKEFGFGSKLMEERINEEISFLVGSLRAKIQAEGAKEFAFSPTFMLSNYSLNIICSILFGRRFAEDEKDLEKIVKSVRKSFSELSKVFIFNVAPFLIHVPFFRDYFLRGTIEIQEEIFELLERKITECSDSAAPKSFIGRMMEIEGEDFDKKQLMHTLHELFLAGTDTSASTLEWALVMLANHPAVQERMYDEMSRHLDPNRPISLDKKSALKFCEATVLELFRVKSVGPITLPHYTSCDSVVMGYDIPADTMVLGNIYSIHMDPDVWKNPEEFDPNRFLDENNEITRRDFIMPFSIGKRSCFGEMLARQEIFLTVCSLVREFRISPPSPLQKIEVTEVFDTTLKPSPFIVALQSRS